MYLYDVTIFCRTVQDHQNHIQTIVWLTSRRGVSLKLKNSFSASKNGLFLSNYTVWWTYWKDESDGETPGLRHLDNVSKGKLFLGMFHVFGQFSNKFCRHCWTVEQEVEIGQTFPICKAERDENWATRNNTASIFVTNDTNPTRWNGRYAPDPDTCDKRVWYVFYQELFKEPGRSSVSWSCGVDNRPGWAVKRYKT